MSDVDTPSLSPASAAVAEFHADLDPSSLNAAALFGGFAPRPLDGEFTWAEFGCGHGITTCIQAAAHPQGRFFGVDRDGKALETGRELAKSGFLVNATFVEADYTHSHSLDDLPPLDFAVAHGVLSWMDVEERLAFMSQVRPLLKPGAILLVTYDALPGRAALTPLRDLLFSVTAGLDGDPMARSRRAMEWLGNARAMQARFFRDNPAIAEMVDHLIDLGPHHLYRAFFGGTLRPHHFAQINGEMEAQGLTFAGRAEYHLNLVDLAVPSGMRKELRNARSRVELEAKRDFLRNEGFRRDIYVNGAPMPDEASREAAERTMILGSAQAPGFTSPEVDFGDLAMSYTGAPFDQVRAALDLGPRTLSSLMDAAETEAVPPSLILEAGRLLLAGGLAMPHAQSANLPEAPAPTVRLVMPHPLNRAMAHSLGLGGPTVPLASKVRGGALVMDNRDALLLACLCEKGREGAVDRVLDILEQQGMGSAASRAATRVSLTLRMEREILPRLPWFLAQGVIEVHA